MSVQKNSGQVRIKGVGVPGLGVGFSGGVGDRAGTGVRNVDIHERPGTAWPETGGAEGSGQCAGDRSGGEAFGKLRPSRL
jgi:hypothetical protein